MDRYAFSIERLREQNFRRLRTFAADGRGKFTTRKTRPRLRAIRVDPLTRPEGEPGSLLEVS